jgi:hypothetical protein
MNLFGYWIYSGGLPVTILGGRKAVGFLEGRAKPIIGVETDPGRYLIDGVVGLFKKSFGTLEAEMKSILVGAGLEEFAEADFELEFIDASAVGQHGNVDVRAWVFVDNGLGQFEGRDVVDFCSLNRLRIATDDLFSWHTIRFNCKCNRNMRY